MTCSRKSPTGIHSRVPLTQRNSLLTGPLDLRSPTHRELLRLAINYIELTIDELQTSHFDHKSKRVEPIDVRREVERCRKWIRIARW